MISVNTRAARSLKISSAYVLLLCVGGWIFFFFLPQDTHALHNSVFPLRLWMFFQAQMQLPPSWGCCVWHLCPESLLGTGTQWGANTPTSPKCGGEIKGIHTTRTGRWAGHCMFASEPDLAPWGQESVCRAGSDTGTPLGPLLLAEHHVTHPVLLPAGPFWEVRPLLGVL